MTSNTATIKELTEIIDLVESAEPETLEATMTKAAAMCANSFRAEVARRQQLPAVSAPSKLRRAGRMSRSA